MTWFVTFTTIARRYGWIPALIAMPWFVYDMVHGNMAIWVRPTVGALILAIVCVIVDEIYRARSRRKV